jgi:antibiotic biosynthesis monooxygenase (ABM) superfamily enzyme
MKPSNMQKLVRMEKVNREVGQLIGSAIQDSGGGYGFALFMFSFDDESEMTWISNAERADMIKALKEFIQRSESGQDDEFKKAQRWNAGQN